MRNKDITLLRQEQTGDLNLLAYEIDELLPLQREKWETGRFPFTLLLAPLIFYSISVLISFGI